MNAQQTATYDGTRQHTAVMPWRWAADAVAALREGARIRLDYSAHSLRRVDRVIEDIRRDGAPYEAVGTVLRGFGAYAGEVLARETGGEWLLSVDGGLWVRTPDGRLWDPLEEARRAYAGHGSLWRLSRDAVTAG